MEEVQALLTAEEATAEEATGKGASAARTPLAPFRNFVAQTLAKTEENDDEAFFYPDAR